LKILQVHTNYRQAGGEDAVVRAEGELLEAAGHTVIRYRAQNPTNPLAMGAGLAVAPWNAAAARRLRRFAEEQTPDLAHVHNTWYALTPAVFAALKQAGVPVVMTLHNFRLVCANGLLFRDGRPCQDCVGSHPWHGVRHRCYRDSALASTAACATVATHRRRGTWDHDVDAFFALTEFARQRFIESGLPADKVLVKPNFTADPGPRANRAADSDFVLFVGRLSPEKGIEQLLHAWNEADPQPLRLLVVGDGPLRNRVTVLAGPRTQVLGYRAPEQVRQLMLRARALLCPSRWYETFALTIVEAMAAGLPVIASNLGGIPDVLHDAAPMLLPPEDHAAWVGALRQLKDGEALLESGKQGRLRYEDRFSETAALDILESGYERALQSRSDLRRAR
jgi:glycosyltransferase involved in cell wall biosynthesis